MDIQTELTKCRIPEQLKGQHIEKRTDYRVSKKGKWHL